MSVSASAMSRVLGIDVTEKNFNSGNSYYLPQRIAIVGQGNSDSQYDTKKYTVLSSDEVGQKYGYGSPLHLAVDMLLPSNNDGVGAIPITIYALQDKANAIAANGEIEITGTATAQKSFKIYVGGISSQQIVISKNDDAEASLKKIKEAIDGVLEMPCKTSEVADGKLTLTAKWKGESGNQISINIDDALVDGLTISKTDFKDGAVNPDVDEALNQFKDIWETFVLSCLNYTDTDSLEKYRTFGVGRWGNNVKKPCLVAHGCTDDFKTRTAITDAQAQINDYVNFLIVSVGSEELPFRVAARGLAKDIVTTANDNPATNYKGTLTQLKAGDDDKQEDYTVRDKAVQLGSSTNIKISDCAALNDTVTFYHPSSDKLKVRAYVCDIVKTMNVLYNCELIFAADEWKGAPLLPDADDASGNVNAKQPKDAKTELISLAKSLSRNAIISDLDFTLSNITASIDTQNPKRLNWTFPVKISGNVEVISGDIYTGVYLAS